MSARIGTASKIDVGANDVRCTPTPTPGPAAAAAVVAVAAHAGGEACMCDLTEPVASAADGLAPDEGCWSTPGPLTRDQRGKWAY
jgi:ArsR family transcriptional regulator, arsenate/arsenite/antimonite-responsive transcriptional repressor